jgi:dTDP-4-amino-4,6-dideoxygalactose transaminase
MSHQPRQPDLPPIDIPFNKPYCAPAAPAYIAEALRRLKISGDGHFSKLCDALLERTLGAPRSLLTTSCTHALEMCALLLDIEPGDEVILPSFTFVSTANAFVLRGAKPVFADVRPDTLNLDERRLAALITPRTKAIVVVHYAGIGCEMDEIMRICGQRSLPVIEDNAHGLFGKYRARWLGTFGALSTLSFHETKNITCGEGGAIVVNDRKLVERAEIIREKGTDRAKFFRGQVDKYTWVDVGSSYLMSDVLAAFLFAQLDSWSFIQARRKTIWDRYHAELHDWAARRGVRQPVVPEHCEEAYHMYYLMLPTLEQRTLFIAHLRSRGILAVFHYVPLHLSPMGRRFGGRAGDCPVTEAAGDQLVRLPFFNDLSDAEHARVIDAVRAF